MCPEADRTGTDQVIGRRQSVSGPWLRSGTGGRSAVLGVLVAMAILAAACSDEPAQTYDGAFREEFLGACQSALGSESATVACGCWYERLSTEIPFEELPTVDELTAPDSLEDVVDPELYERLADCARAFGASGDVPLTAPPPVTVPRPTTTTTIVVEG